MAVPGLVIMSLLLMALYAAAGLKTVKEHQQGLLTRFGKHFAVLPPGLHLIVPFVDKVQTVDLRSLAVAERVDPDTGSGLVRIGAEEWPARSASGEPIGPGTPIEIVQMQGRFVVVAPVR
jgi:hypothetical protein